MQLLNFEGCSTRLLLSDCETGQRGKQYSYISFEMVPDNCRALCCSAKQRCSNLAKQKAVDEKKESGTLRMLLSIVAVIEDTWKESERTKERTICTKGPLRSAEVEQVTNVAVGGMNVLTLQQNILKQKRRRRRSEHSDKWFINGKYSF